MTSDEIRESFLRFFEDKGHKRIPTSSLVPHGDPTLLLTTAGMVQIKPYFLGLTTPPAPRLTSCQKCFRTTDIDSIGDSKHLTFFEMLGNFSVGDYFKKEAITWAWEFVTQYLKLLPQRLWATVYLDDDEASDYWRQVGVPESKILRFGEEDNFWGPAGDSGPCGPCSEMHYDFGEEIGCGRPDCQPNCNCARFSEIWNLVFIQYNQDRDGQRTFLPKPNIDTGMGLERTAAVVQGKSSVYDTDLFLSLISLIADKTKRKYGVDETTDRAIRIIGEHSRGIAFLIADGILPSNEGRGYVFRRVLRRASLFGRRLGLDKPFLTEITNLVINQMGHIYPELMDNRRFIGEVITTEEAKFADTLDTGLNLLDKFIDQALSQGKHYLPGENVFTLYDTYGFPHELTLEIARERGLSVDIEGFEVEMERQRQRARAAQKFVVTLTETISLTEKVTVQKTQTFVGYETTSTQAVITGLRADNQEATSASEGLEVEILLDKTPFYAEMGGQVGDTGEIISSRGEVVVTNTIGNYVHIGKVVTGQISVGDKVLAQVDVDRRQDIARNHTATHLLQAALRQVLGSHIYQKGSLVAPDRFRFDYSQLAPVTKDQLLSIQQFVNEKIRHNLPVKSKFTTYTQAIAEGAIALFTEKYGETVQVIEIGQPSISSELCGGTHVMATGEIGLFLIISEGSIGTGLRRIEAVTGLGAESFLQNQLSTLEVVARELDSPLDEVETKVKTVKAELAAERKRSLQLEKELSSRIVDLLIEQSEKYNGITVVATRVPPLTIPTLREMGDALRERLKSAIIVLGTVYNNRPYFIAMVTQDLVARGYHAGELIKQVAQITGGSGGGKAHLAQAGGKDKDKLDEALKLVKELIKRLA